MVNGNTDPVKLKRCFKLDLVSSFLKTLPLLLTTDWFIFWLPLSHLSQRRSDSSCSLDVCSGLRMAPPPRVEPLPSHPSAPSNLLLSLQHPWNELFLWLMSQEHRVVGGEPHIMLFILLLKMTFSVSLRLIFSLLRGEGVERKCFDWALLALLFSAAAFCWLGKPFGLICLRLSAEISTVASPAPLCLL